MVYETIRSTRRIKFGSNDGPRICSIEANRTLTSPCSSQCLVRATRSSIEFPRCMQTTKALVVILTILTFLRSYLWLVIWFTANTHKLCSNDRFVIWLARADWLHRKLKPMAYFRVSWISSCHQLEGNSRQTGSLREWKKIWQAKRADERETALREPVRRLDGNRPKITLIWCYSLQVCRSVVQRLIKFSRVTDLILLTEI